ncbi:unnamed protein product [Rhizophagus irregularis]|nr:unnamed protein product [Rhizophagus irregularis]
MSESASSSRTHSSVWSHFTLLEEEGKAQCNYFGTKYKRSGGSTTTLHTHLKNKHSKFLSSVIESTKENDEKNKIQEILQNRTPLTSNIGVQKSVLVWTGTAHILN